MDRAKKSPEDAGPSGEPANRRSGRYWTRTDFGNADVTNDLRKPEDSGAAKSGATGEQTPAALADLLRIWRALPDDARRLLIDMAGELLIDE